MKNMQNFAAQQLSKQQMNQVTGGRVCTATLKHSQERVTIHVADSHVMKEIIDAGMMIEAKYGDIATNISCR